jgi:hypothetical protein
MTHTLTNDDRPHPHRWRIALWGAAACVLLVPLVAMRFDTGVRWTGSDFAVMGAMLAAACGLVELGARMSRDRGYRAGVGLAVFAGVALVWVDLAVGIVGDTFDPANLVFAGVLAVGAVGAMLSRLRPQGLARALVATATAQALAGAIAMFWLAGTRAEFRAIAVMSIGLGALWLASAWLVRKAAQRA